jgi:hypothetical protein
MIRILIELEIYNVLGRVGVSQEASDSDVD